MARAAMVDDRQEADKEVPKGDGMIATSSAKSEWTQESLAGLEGTQGPAVHNRVTFNYKNNDLIPNDLKAALSQFDVDSDGNVSTIELVAGARALKQVKNENQFMRKLMLLLSALILVMMLCMFGMTMVATELTKEVKVDQGVLQTPGGDEVLVGSSDMAVGPKGELIQRRPANIVRRLEGSTTTEQSTGMVTVVGLVPRLQSLELNQSRRLQDDGDMSVHLQINKAEVQAVIKQYHDYGVGNFVVYRPPSKGVSITVVVGWAGHEADGIILAAGAAGNQAYTWELFCEDGVEDGRCAVIATLTQGAAIHRMLQARAQAPAGAPIRSLQRSLASKTLV